MSTRPLTPWNARDPISARHLNEVWSESRTSRISFPGANVSRFPNGTGIQIPDSFIPSGGYIGAITAAGPAGEADFPDEQYWVWIQYAIADKWGVTVDIEEAYPGTGSDLTNCIVPATNMCERSPGGPVGAGSHGLTPGFPVLLLPVKGRVTTAGDTTPVQRFMFFSGGAESEPQLEGMVRQGVGNNKAAWKMFSAHYPIAPNPP